MNHASLFPVLRTERLCLRQMTEEDADDLYRIYSNGQVTKYLDWNGPLSKEQAEELIASWNDHYERDMLFPWGIALHTNNRLIGTIMYMPMRGTFTTEPLFPVTLGFELAKEFWNQGLMSEALQAVTQFGIHTIGAHRIQAEVVPENTASLRILEKFGFRSEGLLKKYLKHEVTKLFLDVIILALIIS